jgi:hypothetical protein
MTETIATKLADVARVLADANPADKAEIFHQLGLKLTYYPGRRVVEAEIDSAPCGFSRVSEVRLHQKANTPRPY